MTNPSPKLERVSLPVHGSPADDPAGRTQKQEKLAAKLWAVFQANPVEDGISHPGEVTIREGNL